MSLERAFDCPDCGEERTFWLTASTALHLGERTKWSCTECDHSLIRIGNGETVATTA